MAQGGRRGAVFGAETASLVFRQQLARMNCGSSASTSSSGCDEKRCTYVTCSASRRSCSWVAWQGRGGKQRKRIAVEASARSGASLTEIGEVATLSRMSQSRSKRESSAAGRLMFSSGDLLGL